MALILNLDTSTSVCSVALCRDGKVEALRENNEGLNHSVLLGTYIDEVLEEAGTAPGGLDAVAVSMGPGSYTGLRIGVSMAKGLCFGTGRPLIAVPTLQALAQSVAARLGDREAWYCPMIDARRMEVYTAFFDADNRTMAATTAEIIDGGSFAEVMAARKVYFFGNGSDKVKDTLTSPNAHFVGGVETSAAYMATVAEQKFAAGEFEDVAYFEPFYLKDFIATTAKKKVI